MTSTPSTIKNRLFFLVLLLMFFIISPKPSYAHCKPWHPHHCIPTSWQDFKDIPGKIYGGTKKRAEMVYEDPLGSALNPYKVAIPSFPDVGGYIKYVIKNPDEIVKTFKNPVAGVIGMPIALAIADGRNTALKLGVYRIPEEIKAQLSMYFDQSLLNSVRYTVNDNLINNGLPQAVALNTQAGAITLINVIIFKNTGGSTNVDLWAHEMFHVRQYKELGLAKFAATLAITGVRGENSAIEKPAYLYDTHFTEIRENRHITSGLLVGLGGKCMRALGTSQTSRVVLSACRPNDNLQKWELTANHEVRIPNSNNCLDVQWGQPANRTPLHIWPCSGAKAQIFELTSKGELRSSLKKNLCVEVAGGNTTDGTAIQVFDCNNSPSQFWKKPSVNLISSDNGCLQAVSESKGSLVRLSACNNQDPRQMWSSENNKGEMRLINYPDKCLDVRWGHTSNGTPLHIWPCNGAKAQSFHLTKRMQIMALGKCVDVAGNGNSVQINSCFDNKSTQYWNSLNSLSGNVLSFPPVIIPTTIPLGNSRWNIE